MPGERRARSAAEGVAVGRFCHRVALLWCVVAAGGAEGAHAQGVTLEGNGTLVGQVTNDDGVRDELVFSVDIFVNVGLGPVALATYVEVNSTPFSGGVSELVGGANADAGTALNAQGGGRVQTSELRLVWPAAHALELHAGLLDATGFVDVSRIANDENLFFLGVPFVNNPTIGFPDYALGVALRGAVPGSPLTLGVVVTNTHGLADDPCACYGALFDFGAGVFAASALRWEEGPGRVSLGGWVSSRKRATLDVSDSVDRARGLFAVLGRSFGAHSLSLRLGVANGRVSASRGFVGVTYLLAEAPHALGLGLGRTLVSEALEGGADVTRGEIFVRRRLIGAVFLTASVQRILNSGFDPSDSAVSARLWVGGLRLSAQL